MTGVTQSLDNSNAIVGTTISVYADRGWIVYPQTSGYSRLRIIAKAASWIPYEDSNTQRELYVGSVIVGQTLSLDPIEMDWQYSVDERANNTEFETKSGISWVYREGATVRKIQGNFQGDTSEQVRRYLRDTLRSATNFNETGLVFVLYDGDNVDGDMFVQGS